MSSIQKKEMHSAEYILFSAGGCKLAANSAAVHCIHESLTTQSEDGTQDWFLGLAVADQQLLPVTDLGAFLNGKQSVGRVMEVARHFGIAGLKIDDVHGVSRAQPRKQERESTSTIMDADTSTPGLASDAVVDALVDEVDDEVDEAVLLNRVIAERGEQYRVIDLASLLQSSRFQNVLSPAA